MSDAQPAALEALRSTDATPVAQLHPDIEGAASRVVEGVVTITWPYSSIARSTAFVLAEHDYRLRRSEGQIRVEFRGAAAKALADAAVGGGDELRISLDGALWRKVEPLMKLPQGTLEWQLLFENRLLLSVRRAQDQSFDFIHVNVPQEAVVQSQQNGGSGDGLSLSAVESRPAQDLVMDMPGSAETVSPAITVPDGISSLPAKRQAPSESETDEFASPAFIKRARMSYGALLEDGLGMFVDGKEEKKKGKTKRPSRFSMPGTSWKYSSRSPSPAVDGLSGHDDDDGEPSMDPGGQAAVDLAETSPRPAMVDGGSQTQEAYFSPSQTDIYTSAKTGTITQLTAATTTRGAQYGSNNDSFQTPSRTLFDRPANQPVASRTTAGTAIAFGAHHLEFTAEAHIGSSSLLGGPSASDATTGAAAFSEGIAPPHYPLAPMGNNQLSAPPLNIDPSLQISNEVSAAEHLYYAPGDFAWQANPLAADNSLASVQVRAQDSPFTAADASAAEKRSASAASASKGPSDGSAGDSRLSLSQVGRPGSAGRAKEAGMMSEDNGYHELRHIGGVPGEAYDLNQVGTDGDDGTEERSQPNVDEFDQQNVAAVAGADSFIGYGNTRSRSGSYSSYSSSNVDMEAPHGMEGPYQGGYDPGFELEYNGHYDDDEVDEESDGPGPASGAPREPIVIDLLSDSDEADDGSKPESAASEALEGPARRVPHEDEDAASGEEDGEMSERSDMDDQEDETPERADAGFDENDASARFAESRASSRSKADMEEIKGRVEGSKAMGRGDADHEEHEVGATSSRSQASEKVGKGMEGKELSSSERPDADDEMAASSAKSQVSGRSVANLEENDGRMRSAQAKQRPDAGLEADSVAAGSTESEADDSKQAGQGTEQGEASRKVEFLPRQRANATQAEIASSEHERAGEEGSQHDQPLTEGSQHDDSEIQDARHLHMVDNEETPLADDATDSSLQEAMDVDEAPLKESPDDSNSRTGREGDIEPLEALAEAEQGEMDAEMMASQPPGQDPDDESLSQPDFRGDVDVEDLASQPPQQHDVDAELVTETASAQHIEVQLQARGSRPAELKPREEEPAHDEDDFAMQDAAQEDGPSGGQFDDRMTAVEEPSGSKSDDEFQEIPKGGMQDAETRVAETPQPVSTRNEFQPEESPSSSSKPEQGNEEGAADCTQTTTDDQGFQLRVEEDTAIGVAGQTKTKSSRDKKQAKGSGQELEVQIPVKTLRSRGHSRKTSSAASQELRGDPSISLARTSSPKLSGRDPGTEPRSARLRAAGSYTNDESDPSLALAKATVSDVSPKITPARTTRRVVSEAKDSSPVTTRRAGSEPKTPSAARSKRRPATPETTTRELRSSGRVSSPAESVVASPSIGGSTDEEVAEAKRKLSTTLRTRLPDAEPLRSLRSHLHRTVDVLAVSTMTPEQPHRPKQGPRDYMLELVLTDASTAPGRVAVAQLFRPHLESLPVVQAGDVVLLRRVQVMSLQGRGFGVRAGEQSAWAVFEKDETEMLAQIKGPPVEVTEGEVEYAQGLKEWWVLVMRDERAMTRVDKATQKVSRAKDR